jgi:1-aminocyclopropane-1-carboxylate deaminase
MRNLHSRAHKLNTFKGYIKREDELSFGISGPKLRKLLPLIEALKKEPGVVLEGSAYSNFILGAVQLLREEEIPFKLKLKMPHTKKIAGNLLYLLKMISENQILKEGEIYPKNFRVIPEGGNTSECFEGAKSLAMSIIKNEEELGFQFSKIIIDAGTGVSASGLIRGLSEQKRNIEVHVISLKVTKDEFFEMVKPEATKNIYFHELTKYKSFGSVTDALLKFIDEIAKKEGFFIDPIYGAKVFYELSNSLNYLLDEKSLVIHSGGGLSLSGF